MNGELGFSFIKHKSETIPLLKNIWGFFSLCLQNKIHTASRTYVVSWSTSSALTVSTFYFYLSYFHGTAKLATLETRLKKNRKSPSAHLPSAAALEKRNN